MMTQTTQHNISVFFAVFIICFSLPAWSMSLEKELSYRVQFSKASDVELLLKKGADANHINNVGLPMVSIAASRTDSDAVDVLKTLVKYGADVNRGGPNNQYPIVIAARDNNTPMMEYLVFEAEANYAVRDLNGLLPLEIAEYYGSDDTIEMIRDLTEKKLEEERQKVSLERRDALLRDLAYDYCENQYNYYVYRTNRKKYTKEFINQEISDFSARTHDTVNELYRIWGIPIETAVEIKEKIADPLKLELDAMISNRERRRRGVGTDDDKKKRCERLAEPWLEDFLEREARVGEEVPRKQRTPYRY